MEAEWERNEPPLFLDLPQIGAMLLPFEIVPTDAIRIEGGKANTTYRVMTAGGSFALRVLQRDPRRLEIEARVAERVQRLVKTPQSIGQGDGFLLFEWSEGMTLEAALDRKLTLPYARIAAQLAEVRLALDTVQFATSGFFNGDLVVTAPWPSAVAGWFGYGRLLLDAPASDLEFAVRVESVLDEARPRLEALAGPPALVHSDFKPSNLLVDENGLTAVLDWEFAHSGTRLVDVGQLLRFPEALPPEFETAFRMPLGLDTDGTLLARTLDLINLLDMQASAPTGSLKKERLRKRILQVCDQYEARFGPLP